MWASGGVRKERKAKEPFATKGFVDQRKIPLEKEGTLMEVGQEQLEVASPKEEGFGLF